MIKLFWDYEEKHDVWDSFGVVLETTTMEGETNIYVLDTHYGAVELESAELAEEIRYNEDLGCKLTVTDGIYTEIYNFVIHNNGLKDCISYIR